MKLPGWNLVWHEAMSVDIEELDEDHKRFIDILSRLEAALVHGLAADADALVATLIADTRAHFAREEAMLARYGFYDLPGHAAGHHTGLALLEELGRSIARRAFAGALEQVETAKVVFVEKLILDDIAYKWFFYCNGIRPEIPPVGDGRPQGGSDETEQEHDPRRSEPSTVA